MCETKRATASHCQLELCVYVCSPQLPIAPSHMKSTHGSWHCVAQWSSRRLGLPCGAIARQAPLSSLSAGSADGADLMLPGRRVACRHWRGTPISVLVDLHNTPREHYTCHYSLESIQVHHVVPDGTPYDGGGWRPPLSFLSFLPARHEYTSAQNRRKALQPAAAGTQTPFQSQ